MNAKKAKQLRKAAGTEHNTMSMTDFGVKPLQTPTGPITILRRTIHYNNGSPRRVYQESKSLHTKGYFSKSAWRSNA